MTGLSQVVSMKIDYTDALVVLKRKALVVLKQKEWPLLEKMLREKDLTYIQPYLQDYLNAFQKRVDADHAYDTFHFDCTKESCTEDLDRMTHLCNKAAQAKWYEDWTYRTLRRMLNEPMD